MKKCKDGPRPAVIGTCLLSARGINEPDQLLINGLAMVDKRRLKLTKTDGILIWSCYRRDSHTLMAVLGNKYENYLNKSSFDKHLDFLGCSSLNRSTIGLYEHPIILPDINRNSN